MSSSSTIIDSHAHLDHLENLNEALLQALHLGVTDIVSLGIDLQSNQRNLEIKRNFTTPHIHLSLGIHPGNIQSDQLAETFQWIRKHIKEAIAIGETGLDYWYKWVRKDEEKKAQQREVFAQQLNLAQEFNLPIVIHSRGAWQDCLTMTKQTGIKKALFHWYSGPVDILHEIIESGFYVSTSPSLAYSEQSRSAMAQAPVERILIETDSPVFYQTDDGGFKSTPKDVWRTLKALALLKGQQESEVLSVVNQNARDFFALGS